MASIWRRGAFWRASIRSNGVSISRTFDTQDQAEQWAETEEKRIADGVRPIKLTASLPATVVADLFDRYSREVSPGKGGWRWEQIRLAKLAASFQMPIQALDSAVIADWRDCRLKQVSTSTVNRELNLISAVLTRAIKEWRLPLPANPVHLIQRPPHPKSRKRRVSDMERATIIKQLGWSGEAEPTDIQGWVAWSFCLALETMMRQGEILRMTWEHVHLDRKFVHLPKTKNGEERDVPLSSRAVALFRVLAPRQPKQRVVPVHPGTFGVYFRKAVKSTGIEDLHFHDTRRESLTRLSTKFANPLELGAASGHRDMRSLRIYYRPNPEDLADKLG
jgi:integrase